MEYPPKHPEQLNFTRITNAIRYIEAHAKTQPSLEQIAAHVQLSPDHFQRLFSQWAGTSPKKFLHYLTVQHAKKILRSQQETLLNTATKIGLSGTGRLHDLFVTIEGMTPGEYKNGGEHLIIHYQFSETPFGTILIASTSKGICAITFVMETHDQAIGLLRDQFPRATLKHQSDAFQKQALRVFTSDWKQPEKIKLHLKGTEFQLKVWEALLTIPTGGLATYRMIAEKINNPNACRAVGTAIGSNPVSFLIPCHRVIQSTGIFGNYHWGSVRKTAMIGWEAAHTDTSAQDTRS